MSSSVTVFRPHWIRVAALVSLVVLPMLLIGAWWGMSGDVRATFDWLQITILAIVFGSGAVALWALFRTRVEVHDDVLIVVNGLHRRVFEWPQVVSVSLGLHKSWAHVDLSDGRSVAMMAIQTADGERARVAIRRLAATVAER